MLKSPYTSQAIEKLKYDIKRDEAIVKLALQIVAIHEKLISRLDEVNNTINKKVGPMGPRGLQGIQGPKGDRGNDGVITNIDELLSSIVAKIKLPKSGENGITPLKGIDYLTEEDYKSISDYVIKQIPKQKEITDDDLLHLFTKKKITTKHIDGLEQTLSAFSNQLGRGYLHGGGDTVKAGTNIIITTNADGTKTITATGGSGGGSSVETPGGLVNGINTTFTVSNTPKYVITEQGNAIEGFGYTYSAPTITMSIAPSSFIRSIY